jgi:regulator of sigma E protease
MGTLLALVAYVFPFVATLLAVFATRAMVSRALGLGPFRLVPRPQQERGEPVSVVMQLAVVAACFAAAYVVPGCMFGVAHHGRGRVVHDASGPPAIDVLPGRPAAASGMLDGDTVVRIGEREIGSFAQLAEEVSKHPGETTPVTVERAGRPLELSVDVDPHGKIGVTLRPRYEPVSVSAAALAGIVGPARVTTGAARGLYMWLAGSVEAELAGPAMIVKESSEAARRSGYDWLYMLAAFDSLFGLPFALVLAIFRRPRRRAQADTRSFPATHGAR